jgi:hypothetical protein
MKPRRNYPLRQLHPKHGHARDRSLTYNSWVGLRQRCLYPKHCSYHLYGARGISVDPRWSDFRNFLADMGERPSPQHSIGRLDPNLGYGPDNCAWQLPSEQALNRRPGRWTPEAREHLRRLIPKWPRNAKGRYIPKSKKAA